MPVISAAVPSMPVISAAVPSMPVSSTLPCTSLASPSMPYSKVDLPAATSPWSTVRLPEGSSSSPSHATSGGGAAASLAPSCHAKPQLEQTTSHASGACGPVLLAERRSSASAAARRATTLAAASAVRATHAPREAELERSPALKYESNASRAARP